MGEFEVRGENAAALFTLKLHRGDGMTLLAMNWKEGQPPPDFVGFAIEYREPKGDRFYSLKNRLCFAGADPEQLSTRLAPIQKFRWVHFPRNAELSGEFIYRVTPVFMNRLDELSYGEPQQAAIELRRETYPGQLNIAFTRGFVSSQSFVEKYESSGPIGKLLPANADKGLGFVPTHAKAGEALEWMGFEARSAITEVLDAAIADAESQVRVIAYDLNEPDIVSRLKQLGPRLTILIDDSDAHGHSDSSETEAAKQFAKTAGQGRVRRQHMGNLQHNKTIAVSGPNLNLAVFGSTNFSWRGLYVQSNNAVVVRGHSAVRPFLDAFDNYWNHITPKDFGATGSAGWTSLGLAGIDAKVAFSPHVAANALLESIADDVSNNTTSSLLYSLAFLYQTTGPLRDAITKISQDDRIFVYGVSDRKVGGLDLEKPDGNVSPAYPSRLTKKSAPEPFKSEPSGGSGIRLHHKFVVIDFDKPTGRVYLGSYNFSDPADTKNGENLVLIRDRRIAESYMIEALRICDHYHFRLNQLDAKKALKKIELAKPPRAQGEKAWWARDYADARRIHDRELFA